MDNEITKLRKSAHTVFLYLGVISILALIVGFGVLIASDNPQKWQRLFGIVLFGISGSSVAALTSSLDRYSNGFEKDDGKKDPEGAEGETFNSRIVGWFYVRPFLGAIIAPVFIWGIDFFLDDPEAFVSSARRIAFTAFMGGLLAKSVIELIKGLFKNVFNV